MLQCTVEFRETTSKYMNLLVLISGPIFIQSNTSIEFQGNFTFRSTVMHILIHKFLLVTRP